MIFKLGLNFAENLPKYVKQELEQLIAAIQLQSRGRGALISETDKLPGITGLTGEVLVPGPVEGIQPATLSATGVTPGTYGSTTKSAVLVIGANGRVTTASEVTISGSGAASAVPLLISVNTVLGTTTGWVIPESLEIAAGIILEIEGGARLEITGSAIDQRERLIDIQPTSRVISADVSEQQLYEYVLRGNSLGALGNTRKIARLVIRGLYLNNTGTTRTVRLKVKYGGTTFWDSTTAAMGASSNTLDWMIEILLSNRGLTNSQIIVGKAVIAVSGTGTLTTGLGTFGDYGGATSANFVELYGTGAVDSTADQTLIVSAILSTASTSMTLSRELAILELLPLAAA